MFAFFVAVLALVSVVLVSADVNSNTVEVGCGDFVTTGGCQVQANPILSLRSGSPHTSSAASLIQPLANKTTVQSISFAYSYLTGYATGVGTNFSVWIGDQSIYSSPHYTNYSYNANRSGYSPLVQVNLTNLNIEVGTTTTTQLEIRFQNNDRNIQLALPMQFSLSCDGGESCFADPIWTPPELSTVFTGGEADENGTTCPCFRIPQIAITPGAQPKLLAFAEGRYGGYKPDMSPHTRIVVRWSLDGLEGKRWSPIRVLSVGFANYPMPVVDKVSGKIHLFHYLQPGNRVALTSSTDGETWTPTTFVNVSIGGGGRGIQLGNGRLIFSNGHGVSYSDDHGQNWKEGASIQMGTDVHSLGESAVIADGRTPTSVTLTSRVGSNNGLETHAIATSDDGGETWASPSRLITAVVGPTCQGSIGPSAAGNGKILLSAPFSQDGSLNGRENLHVWEIDVVNQNISAPITNAKLVGKLWGCKGGYSAFDPSGQFNLFEAGNTFRYEKLVLAKTSTVPVYSHN